MIGTRVFAVKLGDFIEFRSANQPPKAKVSKLVRYIEVIETFTKYLMEPPWIKRIKKPVKKELVLKQTFYIGGKVIATTTTRKYNVLAKRLGFPKMTVKGLIELPAVVRDPKWRREHL